MPTSAQKASVTIASFLEKVGAAPTGDTKTAGDKTAAPLSEPGSIGGETSHPVKNVEDRLEKAKEGERSAENKKDVKEDQGPASVESAGEAKAASVLSGLGRFAKAAEGAVSHAGCAATDQIQVGPNKQPTGDDPKNETGSAKGGKEDPGSSHPARTDNTALEGGKYALDANAPLEQLVSQLKTAGDDLVAMMHHITPGATSAQAAAAAPVKTASAQPTTVDPHLANLVGREMAALVTGQTFDKQAADALVEETLFQVVKLGSDKADRFLLFAETFKQAELDPNGGMGGMGGGAPPPPPPGGGMGGGGMGGGGGGENDAMLAALGGGGGGAPPAGGASPGAGGGGGMGGGGGDAELQQILKMLEQIGISPEEAEQLLMSQVGGGEAGGSAPPPGGGAGGAGGGGSPIGGSGGGDPASGGGEKTSADKTLLHKEAVAYVAEILKRSKGRKA